MARVAVLITVFNRREKTLQCLETLYRQADAFKADGKYDFSVYMVDDGCTDGTSDSVREHFPQTNIIRHPQGGLYWARGMRLAWSEASKEDFDFYLWLNDDTLLLDGALASLMDNSEFLRHKAIITGTTRGSGGELTYGGRTKNNKIIEPDPAIPVVCYMFNGNIVLVPRFAYDLLGNLSPVYHHTFADYDYGVRAHKAGISCVVAPGISAICERDHGLAAWRSSKHTLKERWRILKSPKGRPLKEQFIFDSRLKGPFYAIGHGLSVVFKMLFPKKDV